MSAPKVACGPLPEIVDLKVSSKISESGQKVYSVVHQPALWPNNSTVTVSFLDGSNAQKTVTKAAFVEYSTYANLRFVFVERKDAHVKVTFKNPSAWGALGAHALKLEDRATLSLGAIDATKPGDIDRAIALHAVGHVLGLEHEWDAKAVQLADSKDEAISQHVEQFAGKSGSNFPQLDSSSVMNYFLPSSATKDGKGVAPNSQLSASDKAWLVINYPGRAAVVRGVTWNLLQALETLDIPPGVGARILGSSEVADKRAHYADYIAKQWDKQTSVSPEAQEAIKGELSVPKHRSILSDRPLGGAVPAPDAPVFADASGGDTNPPPSSENDDVSNIIAAVLLHPDFRTTVTKLTEADIPNHGVKLENYPIQNANPGDAQQGIAGILGTVIPIVTQVVGSLMAGIPAQQSGINAQQGVTSFQGIQTGQPLPLEVQQGIFDVVTSVLKNPIFTNVVKGIVSGVAQS